MCWTDSSSGLVATSRVGSGKAHTSRVLDEVPPQELETLVVPAEEHSVVLISLLKGFDGLSRNSLHSLFCSLDLFIFL